MKEKAKQLGKDCAVGSAIGLACIIPGLSAGTIVLISGAYERIIKATKNLLSKDFFRNLLILIPYGVAALITVLLLSVPFQLAFKYCFFAIISLFAGFVMASIPGVRDQIEDKKLEKKNTIQIAIGTVIAISIGLLSVLLKANSFISTMFIEFPFYLYFIIFAVGIVGAAGLLVPGFSGSMLLILLGFYEPILNLVSTENLGRNLSLLFVFALGVLAGFIILSKIIDPLLTNHRKSTLYVVIGFICGSLVALYLNSKMFDYLASDAFGLLDWILAPILFIIGFVLSTLFNKLKRKQMVKKDA